MNVSGIQNKRLRRGVLLSLCAVILFAVNMTTWKFLYAEPAMYYVSPSGSDTNSGTIDAPWKTVRKGITSITPGSTLILRGGTYVENIQNASIKPGTPDMPITVKAMAGERPVIQGLLWLNNPSYWTLDGINVTWQNGNTSDEHMTKVTGGTGWRWTNSEIWGAHSYAGMLIAGTPSDWEVDHDVIHDTYASNDNNQDHLIYANAGMGKGTIEHSVFYNSPNGRGIKIGPPSGDGVMGNITIRYNSFYNNLGPSNIQLSGGASGNTIYRNIFQKPGPKRTAITVNSLTGTNNVYKENIAWDTPRMGDPTSQLVDGGGNQLLDPAYTNAVSGDLHPTNPVAADYGAFANDVQVVTPPPTPPVVVDTTAPTVALQTPAGSSTVSGTVGLSASATDDTAVVSVSFYVNSQLLATLSAAPYSMNWDSNAVGDGQYAVTAVAKDAAGNSATSQPVTVTVVNTPAPVVDNPPAAPANLAAANVGPASATISWNAATDDNGVAGYRVYRNDVQVADMTGLSYTDNSLSPLMSYSYRVLAYDAKGQAGPSSSTLQVTTPAAPDVVAPASPAGLSVSGITQTSLDLAWQAASDNIGVTGYIVYRNGTQVGTSAANSFHDSGLSPGTAYSYTVAASDAAGNTSPASVVLAVNTTAAADMAAPSVPIGLAASNITTSSATLTWTASTDNVGVTEYAVYRNGVFAGKAYNSSFTDSGLSASTQYTYTVKASDAAGNMSAASAGLVVKTLTPPDTTPPSVPAGLKTTAVTASSISLAWTASTDASGIKNYTVYRNSAAIGTFTTTTYADSGLAAGTAYSYTVAATDTAGNTSAQSAALPSATAAAAPAVITLRGSSKAASGSVTQLVVARPAGTIAGDVIITSLDIRGEPTLTAPAGWTLVRKDVLSGTLTKATYYHVATAADTAATTYIWKFSGNSRSVSAAAASYGNVDTINPIAVSGVQLNTASSTTATAPTVTAPAASGLLLELFGIATTTSVTPPTGFTEIVDTAQTNTTSGTTTEIASKQLAAAGATAVQKATAAKAGASIGQTIVLKLKP